ncbi:hypothetical protein SELMODRAFT_403828 [Selaginella moellendorffii]|uniref:Bulb-type lectin domain-containing protein n=1 Tax=Selaginella moellendorffii TaxID=88036 RepID=D8QSN9_SELML|nr:hypothetical protein SELMODRAFT_403828 [Selaginella moellendorffii]
MGRFSCIAIVLILIFSPVCGVYIEWGGSSALSRSIVTVIVTAIRNLIVVSTRRPWISTAFSITRSVPIGGGHFVHIRIWITTPLRNGLTAFSPFSSQVSALEIRRDLLDILRNIWEVVVAEGVEFMSAVEGIYGIEYHRSTNPRDELLGVNPAAHYQSVLSSGSESVSKTNLVSNTPFKFLRDSLISTSLRYKLEMRGGCHVALYDRDLRDDIWASGTYGLGYGCFLELEPSPNLAIYDEGGKLVRYLYESGCDNCDRSSALVVQDDGNVVLYLTDTGEAIWATGTNR